MMFQNVGKNSFLVYDSSPFLRLLVYGAKWDEIIWMIMCCYYNPTFDNFIINY
jgi:hypothetical protein